MRSNGKEKKEEDEKEEVKEEEVEVGKSLVSYLGEIEWKLKNFFVVEANAPRETNKPPSPSFLRVWDSEKCMDIKTLNTEDVERFFILLVKNFGARIKKKRFSLLTIQSRIYEEYRCSSDDEIKSLVTAANTHRLHYHFSAKYHNFDACLR